LQREIGNQTLGYLFDIFARIEIPKLDDIPDGDSLGKPGTAVYNIPGTPLQLVRISQGSRTGEFLFNEQSMDIAPRFLRGIENLPIRSTGSIKSWSRTLPQLAGPLVPAALVSNIPESLTTLLLGTPIWKEMVVVIISAIAVLLLVFGRRAMQAGIREHRFAHQMRRIMVPVATLIMVQMIDYYFSFQLNIAGLFSRIVEVIFQIIFYAAAAWCFFLAVMAFFELVLVDPKFPEQSLDTNLLRLIARIIGIIGMVAIIAYGAQNMGLPVLSILAGLGIGGLAIALAIRPTLENLIGGLILYIDRPVRVGDFCTFGGQNGTVEAIGIRSTQIRSLDRTLIYIPNSQFADMQIANWARCDQMMMKHNIGLRYETDSDQLRFVSAKIREMLHSHPRIDGDTIRVRFVDFDPSSLNIEIRVYAKTREWNDFFAIREDILLRINDIVRGSGSGFAFPTQTLYMGKDTGLDPELGEKARQEVASWRRKGQLPFPNFHNSWLERLGGRIHYPPQGSPDFYATQEELAEGGEPLSDTSMQQDAEQVDHDQPVDDTGRKQ